MNALPGFHFRGCDTGLWWSSVSGRWHFVWRGYGVCRVPLWFVHLAVWWRRA